MPARNLVEASPEERDAAIAAANPPENGAGQEELFDGNVFDDPRLVLETRDGRRITELRVGFGGVLELGRYTADDVDWWKSLRLGDIVSLRIEAIVADEQTTERSSERKGTQVIGKKRLRIESVVEMQ